MTLRRMFKRLRLKKGDILLVRDVDVLLQLSELVVPGMDFSVPLVFSHGKHDVEIFRQNMQSSDVGKENFNPYV